MKKSSSQVRTGNDLLAKIRARKAAMMELDSKIDKANKVEEERRRRGFEDSDEEQPGPSKPVIKPLNDRFEHLAEEIRSFFLQMRGRASTNAIMDRFQAQIRPADSFIFKSMLKKVATLKTGSIWLLKDEYK
uniref:Uncharacterized protein n=1 Tax=Panagrolaimus sp. JU765 TaxID=591449 RepID=A0AC34QGN4_9BILA